MKDSLGIAALEQPILRMDRPTDLHLPTHPRPYRLYTSVLRYLSPESGQQSDHPGLRPERSATRIAATTFAPEDFPAKRPSSCARRRAMALDRRLQPARFSSISVGSTAEGCSRSPTPSIL